jgi:hypothetical protein
MECGMIEFFLIALLLLVFICFAGVVLLYFDFVSWIVSGVRHFARARRISDKVGVVVAVLLPACNRPNSPAWPSCSYLLVVGFLVSFFYSTIRKELGPTLLEIVVNYLLMIAIPVNTMVGIEENDCMSWIFCTIPLDMLGVMALVDNYQLARRGERESGGGGEATGRSGRLNQV